MSNSTRFKGIIPPVSTLFDDKGQFDQQGMGRLIDYLIHSGVNGLFFLGSGGEFSQMSIELRKEIAAFSIKHVAGRVPVLIGTGSVSTCEAIELSNHSKENGADAVVIINPFYLPVTEENLFNHFAKIAESVDIPILLYNFPGVTGQDLSPEFVLKLARKYSNIVGIKETIDLAGHIREVILTVKAERPDFVVLSGYDDHLLNTLSLGGDGAISASVNFAPELQIGIYKAFQEGDYGKAIELHKRLAHLPAIYKLDAPFVNVVKEAIRLRGAVEISSYSLSPATPLTNEKKERLRAILVDAGLL
jgi:4-hydroxy-tetrahydrodipicolinate synthase